jgi:CubicO group peptidase (beta-lactamase class C family)
LLGSELERIARRRQAERRLPSLSAAVFRRGELLWQQALGLADAENEVAATPDTQYRVGSITKTFTAVAIMRLRDAGELSLEDTLGDHITDAPHARPTVRQLLAHLSGLQREPPGEVWETLEDPTVEELLARLPQAERVLEPGAYWHYSNLAYALLGEIVARRSGMPATRFVGEHGIEPLGLARTTWLPSEPFARGYLVEPYSDALRPEKLVELRGSAPIGQLWSTTGDLARWGAFLLEGAPGVLERGTVEEMHAFQALVGYVKGWKLGWGLGLQLSRDGDRILVGHGGAMPGFLAHFAVSPEDGIGAVALTNSSANAFVDALALELARKTTELEPGAPDEWRPAGPPPAEVAGLLGHWWSEGLEYVFRWSEGRLEATLVEVARAIEPTVFEQDGPDRFRPVGGLERGELLRVVRDEAGEPVRLYWATYPFTRSAQTFG